MTVNLDIPALSTVVKAIEAGVRIHHLPDGPVADGVPPSGRVHGAADGVTTERRRRGGVVAANAIQSGS
jgi:hypothetical protein